MHKQLIFNGRDKKDVQEKLRSGIRQLAEAVKITLGPTGRVVMYEREYGTPVITKDGVTVAKQVDLADPLENMAASMVRQAASKTASVAGDGTTTATIYAEAIYEAGIKSVGSGANPLDVKRGVDHAVAKVVEQLAKNAKPILDVEQIKQVAICSSNQDAEIGSMIAEAMDQVGTDGVITIEEGQSLETTIRIIDGLQFPRGYLGPQFATNPETLMCEYDDACLMLIDGKITDLKKLIGLLEVVVKNLKNQPTVIIADDFSDDCLTAMIVNRIKAQLNIVPVKAPGFGDRRRSIMEDIAIATGGDVVSVNDDVKVSNFGKCKKVKIDRDTTTILEGNGKPEKIEERINLLRSTLDKVAGDFDKEQIQERLARLTGGVAQIAVGGATETEVREKKDRIDDAVHACKAAIEEGILPGGGIAVLHALKDATFDNPNEDFKIGVGIVQKALQAPLRQIAKNTGEDDGVIVDKVVSSKDKNFGFDAALKRYGNMVEFGIIVPAKVERVALQNAASVAGLMLTTDCMISIVRDDKVQAGADTFPHNMM